MKYKALICDFDGTLVAPGFNGMPSASILNALSEANHYLFVGIATGRPFYTICKILEKLPLSAPCIINGGAQIYDPFRKKIIKEYELNREELDRLLMYLKSKHFNFYINDGQKDFSVEEKYPARVLSGVVVNLNIGEVHELIKQSFRFPNIILHQVPTAKKGVFDVEINHISATKQHGIVSIAEILAIKTEEIISIGDSYNDFPLLMASGFKVAMGNAFADLKEIADYVAPSVEKDGVVDVINKFVIN